MTTLPICEKLRGHYLDVLINPDGPEAAATITALTERLAQAESALRPFALEPDERGLYDITELGPEQFDAARAALNPTEERYQKPDGRIG